MCVDIKILFFEYEKKLLKTLKSKQSVEELEKFIADEKDARQREAWLVRHLCVFMIFLFFMLVRHLCVFYDIFVIRFVFFMTFSLDIYVFHVIFMFL